MIIQTCMSLQLPLGTSNLYYHRQQDLEKLLDILFYVQANNTSLKH